MQLNVKASKSKHDKKSKVGRSCNKGRVEDLKVRRASDSSLEI